MSMDFKKEKPSQLHVWASLHYVGCRILEGLMDYVDTENAAKIRSGQIRANPVAFGTFLSMTELLETSLIANDGRLDLVYEDCRKGPYMRALWDKLKREEFMEALALSLSQNGVAVRADFGSSVWQDVNATNVTAEELDEQWREDNLFPKD
jgi:hypothetical protein